MCKAWHGQLMVLVCAQVAHSCQLPAASTQGVAMSTLLSLIVSYEPGTFCRIAACASSVMSSVGLAASILHCASPSCKSDMVLSAAVSVWVRSQVASRALCLAWRC